jgi:hypothetical protein
MEGGRKEKKEEEEKGATENGFLFFLSFSFLPLACSRFVALSE